MIALPSWSSVFELPITVVYLIEVVLIGLFFSALTLSDFLILVAITCEDLSEHWVCELGLFSFPIEGRRKVG